MAVADESFEPLYSVLLTEKDIYTLAGLCRSKAKRYVRQRAKSDFVPEPGHRHMDEVNAERFTELHDMLLESLPHENL